MDRAFLCERKGYVFESHHGYKNNLHFKTI